MTEILIAVVAFAAGGLIAWLWKGSLARTAIATAEARLGFSEQQHAEKTQALESRVLVSARKLRDLKSAPEDVEIEAIELLPGSEGRVG